ncbi:hypothetical protein RFI_18323 [Reticulomyxa filosa]|uniref:Uncharacterized protein n=1 Tax=Reticulomyxa filosa TaxID=46433 RepID=X6MZM7_RETFI|nr:hypothetical protein RFI_18323 [Reticulomyxa filosa]|eukprot:ETO18919.1 hypothetical protein RFI_18323 [Reticulomyxa filosa]
MAITSHLDDTSLFDEAYHDNGLPYKSEVVSEPLTADDLVEEKNNNTNVDQRPHALVQSVPLTQNSIDVTKDSAETTQIKPPTAYAPPPPIPHILVHDVIGDETKAIVSTPNNREGLINFLFSKNNEKRYKKSFLFANKEMAITPRDDPIDERYLHQSLENGASSATNTPTLSGADLSLEIKITIFT